MPLPPKKRNRDPFGPRVAQKRYAAISQHANVYLEGSLARPVISSPKRRKVCKQKQKAAKASWGILETPEKSSSNRIDGAESAVINSPFFHETRRTAIYHLYLAYGMPAQSTWDQSNFVAKIIIL